MATEDCVYLDVCQRTVKVSSPQLLSSGVKAVGGGDGPDIARDQIFEMCPFSFVHITIEQRLVMFMTKILVPAIRSITLRKEGISGR